MKIAIKQQKTHEPVETGKLGTEWDKCLLPQPFRYIQASGIWGDTKGNQRKLEEMESRKQADGNPSCSVPHFPWSTIS